METESDFILERMMSLHPKIIDLTLDRMHRLLAALSHPERRLPPVIHLAGTNGKGSTQAMIRAGLEAAGHRVHAYTSPHLARFHERIRLAGNLISEPDLTRVLDQCYAANDGAAITYFEITTCAALLAMAETPADFTLLETGLGGRLDATNVVDTPRLTVITPVDLDHQDFLGDTLAQIAAEKAGVIKRGVPCIVAPQHDEAGDAIEKRCAALGAPRSAAGEDWHVTREHDRLIFQDDHGLLDLPLPRLAGPHQIVNAGTAIAALRALGLNETACEAAITTPEWQARMQRLQQGQLTDLAPKAEIWLDGGHNPAAGQAIAQTLKEMPERPTHLICGMLNTKDFQGYLAPIAPLATSFTAISIPGEANAAAPEQLAQGARDLGLNTRTAPDLRAAISMVISDDAQARVLICGSLYLAGEVLRQNG